MNRSTADLSFSPNLHRLNCDVSKIPRGGYLRDHAKPRAAAVLVPIVAPTDADGRAEVVLTVRADNLAHHAGQVAFPGGAREPGDASVVETALREAREETGLAESSVEPLGYLDRFDTVTGYRMTAVVGWVRQPVDLVSDEQEVAAIFTVPLSHVADPSRYRVDTVRYDQKRFKLLTLAHDEYRIWGATAALLNDLGRRLR